MVFSLRFQFAGWQPQVRHQVDAAPPAAMPGKGVRQADIIIGKWQTHPFC
jgi:hypothetical protein